MRTIHSIAVVLLLIAASRAQESPYIVTYDHHLEDVGDLELETFSTVGIPRQSQDFYFAPYTEIEYGVTSRWTSELYIEGQSTSGDSSVFTGWRWENRYRPFAREHRINPVLYLEYENVNEASRIQKEIVGNAPGFRERNDELSQTHAHELETKLILSSDLGLWNVAENFIVEKNISEAEGVEFGYAIGVSRPLSGKVAQRDCRLCLSQLSGGFELYGGLGSSNGFGFHDTAHYAAPVIAWKVSDHATLHFSPAIGLTGESNPVLLRFGYSYELEDFGTRVARFLGRKH